MFRRAVSAVVIAMLLTGMLTLASNVQPVTSDYVWTETIYIRTDGSIYPSTAPIHSFDNVTYTLTDNIAGNVPGGFPAIAILRDNIIIDGAGHMLQGTNALGTRGIELWGRSNVTIKNMKITAFYFGIGLEYSCNNNRVSANNIRANNADGIYLWNSSNNRVSGNNIAHNYGGGIVLDYSSNNNHVSGNNITANNYHGIALFDSSDNSVSGNDITANNWEGIVLSYSSNNIVSGNNIKANNKGIYLISSNNNTIYHNNFVNNTIQAYSYGLTNAWDDGYPSGGNYWSDYARERGPAAVDLYHGPYQNETGSDGIGDTPYIGDNYPLMGPFSSLGGVSAVSNSTISGFQCSEAVISFNVTGQPGTTGFCTLTILHSTLSPSYIVMVDGNPIQYTTVFENDTVSIIYFTYQHSTHEVTITGNVSGVGGSLGIPHVN